ncbi:hypothetical protein B0G74_7888 [Paraburkholderia sp. BL9I2N2]|nr:hypothetical protein B0G74_7888 [Paraburkholderia sp. BL9I2N2]
MMLVALFKSALATTEGESVWGKLRQKVVETAEAPAHVAEGWYESAAEALEAHELAVMEAENAKLQEQIAAEQTKLDGRTKAARQLKAKLDPTDANADGIIHEAHAGFVTGTETIESHMSTADGGGSIVPVQPAPEAQGVQS